eukprot:ctg_126.g80
MRDAPRTCLHRGCSTAPDPGVGSALRKLASVHRPSVCAAAEEHPIVSAPVRLRQGAAPGRSGNTDARPEKGAGVVPVPGEGYAAGELVPVELLGGQLAPQGSGGTGGRQPVDGRGAAGRAVAAA